MRCTVCGRFVPYDDTTHINMVTPDSALTAEEWEILCQACYRADSCNK